MNLYNLNLVELNGQEVQEVEGGNVALAFWGLYMLYEVAGNPNAHWKAFKDGFNYTK
jgi:hypothetical protein